MKDGTSVSWAQWLFLVAAVVEAATGLGLIVVPEVVVRLLFGGDLAGVGFAIGRIAGFALLSIGLLCWMSRREPGNLPILASMFSYNLPVTLYLAYLGIGGEAVGLLLWPAVAFHAVMTILFAACVKAQLGRAGTGSRA